MASDEDIAASLPRPPQPNPARRAAAIDQALRRFDGEAAAPARPAGQEGRRGGWSGRRYAGAFATVALVALVGVPVAWKTLEDRAAIDGRLQSADPAAPRSSASAPADGAPQIESSPSAEAVADPAPDASVRADATSPVATADLAPAEDEAAPPAPPAPDLRIAQAVPAPTADTSAAARAAPAAPPSDERIVVTGSRIEREERSADAALAVSDERGSESIVVTGTGRSPRGSWNACTIDDPARRLSGCRSLADPGARGNAGRAAAYLSDGLTRAWQGDTDGAIAAFDRAIAVAPRYPLAYLNRGMAHRRNGDLDRALVDLNLAVRHAPRSARAYYQRSLLLRQRGNLARARQDERRAVALDPRYGSALPDHD